jgi:hypothetical protein
VGWKQGVQDGGGADPQAQLAGAGADQVAGLQRGGPPEQADQAGQLAALGAGPLSLGDLVQAVEHRPDLQAGRPRPPRRPAAARRSGPGPRCRVRRPGPARPARPPPRPRPGRPAARSAPARPPRSRARSGPGTAAPPSAAARRASPGTGWPAGRSGPAGRWRPLQVPVGLGDHLVLHPRLLPGRLATGPRAGQPYKQDIGRPPRCRHLVPNLYRPCCGSSAGPWPRGNQGPRSWAEHQWPTCTCAADVSRPNHLEHRGDLNGCGRYQRRHCLPARLWSAHAQPAQPLARLGFQATGMERPRRHQTRARAPGRAPVVVAATLPHPTLRGRVGRAPRACGAAAARPAGRDHPPQGVGSGAGRPAVFRPWVFPSPPAEPAVRVATQRALHGSMPMVIVLSLLLGVSTAWGWPCPDSGSG